MPASAAPIQEEVRRLIGALNAGGACVLALGDTAPAAPGGSLDTGDQVVDLDRPTVVVKLSDVISARAALELLGAACGGVRQQPQIQNTEADHVHRAAS